MSLASSHLAGSHPTEPNRGAGEWWGGGISCGSCVLGVDRGGYRSRPALPGCWTDGRREDGSIAWTDWIYLRNGGREGGLDLSYVLPPSCCCCCRRYSRSASRNVAGVGFGWVNLMLVCRLKVTKKIVFTGFDCEWSGQRLLAFSPFVF